MREHDESAFPAIDPPFNSGMTLRDWFAGQALSEWVRAHIENSVDDLDKPTVARECYSYADAMLAARKEPKP